MKGTDLASYNNRLNARAIDGQRGGKASRDSRGRRRHLFRRAKTRIAPGWYEVKK